MKINKLENMDKGWFVGSSPEVAFRTSNAEVAVKQYNPGDRVDWHYHKIATEITVILKGHVRMNEREFYSGDVIVMEPGEGTDLEAIEKTTSVIVKIPCVTDDIYF